MSRYAFTPKSVAAGLTGLIAIAIAVLTLIPVTPPLGEVPGSDKLYHIIAFAALTIPTAALYPRWVIWAFPGTIFFGALIEVVQPFVGRTGSMGDLYADGIGAVLGVILGLTLGRIGFRHLNRIL